MTNPFKTLSYESVLESLGNEFFDVVRPATFPQHILHFRNNDLLNLLGLKPDQVSDRQVIFYGSGLRWNHSEGASFILKQIHG